MTRALSTPTLRIARALGLVLALLAGVIVAACDGGAANSPATTSAAAGRDVAGPSEATVSLILGHRGDSAAAADAVHDNRRPGPAHLHDHPGTHFTYAARLGGKSGIVW